LLIFIACYAQKSTSFLKTVRRSPLELLIKVLMLVFEDSTVDVVRFSKWAYFKYISFWPSEVL
jgi:hypothetical protein